ncbi:MAG: Gfo/Idh/MocA family oxidoreductase [Sulfolobales archaeon]
MIRFAIVSFAHMHAHSYVRVLKELEREGIASLKAIYDDDIDRLRITSEIYRPEKIYKDIYSLAEDRDIEAVIIASENVKHREHAIPMIRSGKHVLVEKPIATRYRDGYEMVEEARRHGVKLQVAFVMRYHDASIEVKRGISDIGKIFSITAANRGKNPLGWFVDPDLAGGGAFMDHIVHVADLIRWYTDKEFIEVTAFKAKNIVENIKVEDNGIIIAKLQDDILASIDCSWSIHPRWPVWGDVYMHIIGERGAIMLNAFNQNIYISDEKGFRGIYYGPDADRNMIESFINAIEKDIEPIASGIDGLRALEVVLAAYKSIQEGRAVRIEEIRSSSP